MKTASYWIFIFTLIFSPLAFGSAELWSMAVMQFLVPLGLGFFLMSGYSKDQFRAIPGITPLILLLLFMSAQLIPLPQAVVGLLSPASLAVYQPLIDLPNGPNFVPISVNIKATIGEVCRFTTYALFYIFTIQITASYPRLRKTLFIIVGLAAGIAFLAIIQKFSSPDKIYWLRQVPDNASATGPWVSRNQFAGFMEMMTPFALALFLRYRPRIRYAIPLREKITSVLTLPTANLHILFGFATFVMGLSILVSLSRGGIISTTLSGLCFLLILTRTKQLKSSTLSLAICFFTVLILATWIGWEPVIDRFNRMTNSNNEFFDGRFLIWADTWPILKDYWLTGSGFGTFIHIFPTYREMMPPGTIIDHAHNDYLELFACGGLIGTGLVFWFLGSILLQAIRTLQQRRDGQAKLLGTAALCSLLALAFHSVTDFNMYNGANGLYFFFICGLLISTTHTRKRSKQATYLKTIHPPRLALGIPLICIGIGIFMLNQGKAQAYQTYSGLKNIYLNRNMDQTTLEDLAQKMQTAMTADPLSGTYPFALGNIYTFINDGNAVSENYIKALYRNPLNPSYLMQAGYHFSTGDPQAEFTLLQAAARADKTSSWVKRNLASWYLKQGKTEQGIQYLKTALLLERKPDQFNQYIAIALTGGISILEFEEIVPKTTKNYIQMGTFLAKEKDFESATFYYKEGMKHIDPQDLRSWYFNAPFWFFWRQKQFANAMLIARTAVEFMPDDLSILLMAGDIYRQQELSYKAQEYYQQALLVEPGNARAKRGMRALQSVR